MPLLPDALLRHAAATPEAPWLFYPDGLDWRWLSWGEAARRVTDAAASLPDGERVAWPDRPAPEALLHALARHRELQAAGQLEGDEDELRAGAAAVGREVARAGPPAGGREILVLGRSLAEAEERAVLAWALKAGAALLLEPDPSSYASTAAWARPTLFHGTAAEIAALRRLIDLPPGPLARLFRRPPGLPFGRLRAVLYLKEGQPSPEDEEFWRRRGVRVLRYILL